MRSARIAAAVTAVFAVSVLLPAGGCSPGQPVSPAGAAPSVSGEPPSSAVLPVSDSPESVSADREPSLVSRPGSSSSPPESRTDSRPALPPVSLDDAVFIGDSVTLKLKNYVTIRRRSDPSFFGKAKFLAAGSMGSGNALKPLRDDSIHPSYNGEKALLEDSAAKMKAGKIYIMLGINDIASYGVERSAQNLEKLTLRFLAKLPDARIYIQSATPMLKNKQMKTLNNENIVKYNEKLREICNRRRWNYLDIATALSGDDGALKPEYCSDPDELGLHFTDRACKIWISIILTHSG